MSNTEIINARTARELTEQALATNIDCSAVFKDIQDKAARGASTHTINLKTINVGASITFLIDGREIFARALIKQLETLGFKTTRNKGSDQRDNESWDTLVVSWYYDGN